MITERIRASEAGAILDCDIHTGGGTDDTAVLQRVLDRAGENHGIYLIMDGAALVTGLKLHSNTTVFCENGDCGFYLKSGSDCPLISNAEQSCDTICNRNITLQGGTYNHNAPGQKHSIPNPQGFYKGHGISPDCDLAVALEFIGVERLTLRDIYIYDQRTYALLAANWRHVVIENAIIELPNRMHGQNQDGFHFFGPGQFLSMRNVGGRTSDDFIALNPDENDDVSSITDVDIDGVHLDDADQAIRMLCHGAGRLDRVVVKNVTGTYRSYGFFINPFWPSERGSYGNIIIDTVDLRQNGVDYDYTPPFLFRIGGRVESITLRNIYHHCPIDSRTLLDVGWQFYTDDVPITPERETRIGTILVDGLHVYESAPSASAESYIRMQKCHIRDFTVRNVEIVREDEHSGGKLFDLHEGTDIGTLRLDALTLPRMDRLIDAQNGASVRTLSVHGVLSQETPPVYFDGDAPAAFDNDGTVLP